MSAAGEIASPSHGGGGSGKKRTPNPKRACEFCKQRHLKCDAATPCFHCERRNIECIYLTGPGDSPNGPIDYSSMPSREFDSMEPPMKKVKLTDTTPQKRDIGALHRAAESLKDTVPHNTTPKPRQKAPKPPKPEKVENTLPSTAGAHYGQMLTFPAPGAAGLAAAGQVLPPLAMSVPNSQSPVLLPGMQFHPSPFPTGQQLVPQPQMGVNNGSNMNNAISNGLIVAYARAVSPFASMNFTVRDAADLQRLLQTEKNRLSSIDTPTLVKAFVECTMVAHGSRYCSNFTLAQKYADKSQDILRLLLTNRQNMASPEFTQNVQSLVSGMELLTYFCIGSDELLRCRQLITEAGRLLTIYKKNISTATAHRILGLQIGACADNEDAFFYLQKATRLQLPAETQTDASGYVVLALMLSGRCLTRGDTALLPHLSAASETDSTFHNRCLEVLDQCEMAVKHFESTQKQTQDLDHLLSVYRGVLAGARAVTYWHMGLSDKATSEAAKIIQMGRSTPICKLPYLLAYAYALQVVRVLGHSQLLQQGLPNLEADAPMYPAIQRMANELKQPLRPEEVPSGPSGQVQQVGQTSMKGAGAFSPIQIVANGTSSSNSSSSVASPAGPASNSSNQSFVPPGQAAAGGIQIPQQQRPPTPIQTATNSAPATPSVEPQNDYFGARGFEPYAASIVPEHLGSISTPSYLYPSTPHGLPPFLPGTMPEMDAQAFDASAYWPTPM